MKADVWVWDIATDYPGAENNDAVLPISRVWVKTHERNRWFSPAEIKHLSGIYGDQGIAFAAWCVPTGLADDAALAIAVLGDMRRADIAEPWLQFDWEVEPGNFWQGSAAQAIAAVQAVKAACPWAKLAGCYYQWDNRLFGIDTIAPLMDLNVSMSYWTDFHTAPEIQLARDYAHLSFYGRPVQLGLPGNATADEMERGLRWCKANQKPGDAVPVIWRRGTTTRAVWDVIAAFEMAEKPEPVPDPRDEHIQQLTASKIGLRDGYTLSLESMRAERQAAQNVVTRLDAAIRGAEAAIQKWGT